MQHLGHWPRELLAVSSEGWEVRLFLRLTPSRMPTETKSGPKGRERDLARPPAGAGGPFEGPAEATEAMRGPVGFTGEGAGENGFGDFCRNKSHPPYGAGAPLVHVAAGDSN